MRYCRYDDSGNSFLSMLFCGSDVTIQSDRPLPNVTFCHYFGYPLPPTPADILFEWPLLSNTTSPPLLLRVSLSAHYNYMALVEVGRVPRSSSILPPSLTVRSTSYWEEPRKWNLKARWGYKETLGRLLRGIMEIQKIPMLSPHTLSRG